MRSRHLRRRPGKVVGVAALVGILAATASVFAVPVRGTLEGTRDLGSAATVPNQYWSKIRNGAVDVRDDRIDPRRELAVVLTGEGGDPVGCDYGLDGGDLMPRTIVVKAGTTLRIVNSDGCSHELEAEGIEGFSALSTAPGNARAVPIPSAGNFALTDRLYPHISGHVHAIADLVACGTIEASGAFAFEDVPVGTYTLKVFRGDREVASAPVEVGEAGPVTLEPISLTGGATADADESDTAPAESE